MTQPGVEPSKLPHDVAERIVAEVREDEIVSMACEVINIPSPTGDELAMGNYLQRRWEEMGLRVVRQEVEEGRANIVARYEGRGAGRNLMFNGHMDTSNTGREPFLAGIGYKPSAVVKNGMIYGLGIYNMKGALVCYTQAVRALQRAGVAVEGDVILAAVVGEIEKAQVGRFQGKSYRGAGVGARYMMDHGVMADMCIIGEPTGLHLQIGAIDGGNPFKPGTRPTTDIYVIVKTLPGTAPLAIKRELEAVCDKVRKGESDILDTRVDLYLSTDGYEISRSEFVVKAMERAHKTVFGRPVPYSKPIRYGITSDGSRIAAYGVPSITYGPGFGTHLVDPTETKAPAEWDTPGGVRRGVGIDNMVSCTKVYAMAAVDICNQRKEEVAKS